MSWNINIVGKPEDVRAAIEKDQNLPQQLKDVVALYAEATAGGGPSRPTALHVQTLGHFDRSSAWGNLHSFSIAPVTLAASPPADAPQK